MGRRSAFGRYWITRRRSVEGALDLGMDGSGWGGPPAHAWFRWDGLLPTSSGRVTGNAFVISPPEGLTLNGFSVSPDGRRVGFIASGSDRSVPSAIWVRPIDAVTAQPLPGTEGATSLFWSPDSRFIAFFTRFSKLKKIDLSGGGPITLCCDAKIFVGVMPGTWNRDGL